MSKANKRHDNRGREDEPASRPAPDSPPVEPSNREGASADGSIKSYDEKLEEIKDLLLVKRTAESADLITLLTSKRRLAASNLTLGLFRGIGFFLGFTLVGSLVLGTVALTFGWIEDLIGLDLDEWLNKMAAKGETLQVQTENGGVIEKSNFEELVREVLRKEDLIADELESPSDDASPTGDGAPAEDASPAEDGDY